MKNPYGEGHTRAAWLEGYKTGKKQDAPVLAYNKGKSDATDDFIERLILLAQEYGSDRFVFKAHDMEELLQVLADLKRVTSSIETLR